MTKATIRRITKIENFRIFQNWKQSSNMNFARVNLIYGQNGSGKSTLANLMLGCADATRNLDDNSQHSEVRKSGLKLEVGNENNKREIELADSEFWGRVRVFNKDFVRRNLRFDKPDGLQPEALLTLGERLADAERKIEELESKRKTALQDLDTAESALKAAQKKVNGLCTETATKVCGRLSGTPGFNPRSYNRTKVEALLKKFEGDPTVLDDASTDPIVDCDLAKRRPSQPIHIQPRGTLLEQGGLDEARRLLTASVVSNRHLDELVGHPDRSRWVQEGIGLHEGLTECLFCGGGLTSDRRDALNAHFDESFKKLQTSIGDLIERLDASIAASKTYLDAFPADSDVYEDLREDLRKARDTYEAEHGVYRKVVETISVALKEKKDNPFSTPALPSDLALVAPSIATLEKVVKDHQSKIDSHEDEAKKAATRVEHYYVKDAADDYARFKTEVEDKRAERKKLETQVNELNEQIAALKNVEGDPIPGAKELTEGLRRLLGRDELEFNAQDSKHYAIEREGSPATHLSEGEQTAIALLYFLSSVREDKIAGDPPIIIIDDPVSSLDHGILFGASANIWSELVVNPYASQVFLMTHNFELFRQWLVQMETVPENQRKGGYMAYSICARIGERGRREPVFEVWKLGDKRTKKLRSQYHFLFDQVATTLEKLEKCDGSVDLIAQTEAAALVPNAARKLLEGFLSFRTPANMGNLRGSVHAVLEEHSGLNDSVRTMVLRFAHANSHLEEADPTKPLELSESVPFLRALFTFMDHVDREHFGSMCKALGHTSAVLRGVSPS